MQCELTIYSILRSERTNEIKADKICELMVWERPKVLEALSQTNGHSQDDRQHFIEKFWGKPKRHGRRD